MGDARENGTSESLSAGLKISNGSLISIDSSIAIASPMGRLVSGKLARLGGLAKFKTGESEGVGTGSRARIYCLI